MNIRVSMAGALPAMLRSADETPREWRTHRGLRRKHQAAVAMLTGWLAVFYSGFTLRLQAGCLPTALIALAALPRSSTQASADTSRRAAG